MLRKGGATYTIPKSKGSATRNDFVNDIANDARADAIFATLKAIVDDIVDDIVTCGMAFRLGPREFVLNVALAGIRLLLLIRKHKDSFNRTKILVNGTFAVE